jgi:hypothetical protein
MCACDVKIDAQLWLHLTSAHHAPSGITGSDDDQAARWHEAQHTHPGSTFPAHDAGDTAFW